MEVPSTYQVYVNVTASPSASESLTLATIVSSVVAGSGLMVTSATSGAVLSMVIEALSLVPSSVPSFEVTVQMTSSPPTNAPESVVPIPEIVPFTVHSMLLLSVSPSASVKV